MNFRAGKKKRNFFLSEAHRSVLGRQKRGFLHLIMTLAGILVGDGDRKSIGGIPIHRVHPSGLWPCASRDGVLGLGLIERKSVHADQYDDEFHRPIACE